MNKIIITEKIDFVEPYRVQLLPDLSLHAKPIVSWTFSKLENAIEVATNLAERHNARHYIFGNEISKEAEKIVNIV